jgi:hypothetical protein
MQCKQYQFISVILKNVEEKLITSRKVLDIAKLLTETKDPLGALCRDHLQVFNTLLS